MKFQYIADYRGLLTRGHLCRLTGVTQRGLDVWKHRHHRIARGAAWCFWHKSATSIA